MASGIVELGTSGLFENEIEFNGKHARMVRFLKEEIGVFATFREAYVLSAAVGFLNKAKETSYNGEKIQPASIFKGDLSARKLDLKFLYRVMMLAEDVDSFTIDDYMNKAFRDDSDEGDPEKFKNNMATFNSYACGGLEYLYKKFENLSRTDDVVNALYDFVHGLIVDLELLSDEDLPDFTPSFN